MKQEMERMQPSTAPAPGPVPMPRPRSWLRLAIIVVIVIVVVAVSVAVVYPLLQQPKITLTDKEYFTSGCGVFGPYFIWYTWYFNLTNTGSASGFATVTFTVNNLFAGTNTYYVPQGATVAKVASVKGVTGNGYPCPAESPDAVISAVTKA